MFGSLGFTELILILFIVLVIFGAGKLPQLGEGIGKAIKGFKRSVHDEPAIDVNTDTSTADQGASTQSDTSASRQETPRSASSNV